MLAAPKVGARGHGAANWPMCETMLAQLTTPIWPTPFNALTVAVFVLAAFALPALGYVFLALDIRRHLRSLKRMLICVANSAYSTPRWALPETPRCLEVLGLQLPCGEEELKRAYREKVKRLHPDRGGDKHRFLMLQSQFQEALRYVAEQSTH